MSKPSILVVVGPTASGKSELAVQLAKKYNGEIISADSRQIYRGLDIGSGKVTGKWTAFPLFGHPERLRTRRGRIEGSSSNVFLYKGIPHYLIDEASPRLQYSVARFQKNARKVIADILSRGKLPIICGGSAHWIDAVVFEQSLPKVKPDARLRAQLNKLTTAQLFAQLKKLDPARAKTIDAKNPRRLIRALEIALSTGKPIPKTKTKQLYQTLWLGLRPNQDTLESNIHKRLQARLKQGLLKEVIKLHEQGLSWQKLEAFGLEYKFCALYLQDKLNRGEMEQQLFIAIRQYAKRQMTWWKRNQNIHWSDKPIELLTLAKPLIC